MATIKIQGVETKVNVQNVYINGEQVRFEGFSESDVSGSKNAPQLSIMASEMSDAGKAAYTAFMSAMQDEYALRHTAIVTAKPVVQLGSRAPLV